MAFLVNKERMENDIEALAQFGLNEKGGVDRSIGSEMDLKAREWLCRQCESFGAEVKVDAIANVFATIEGREQLPPLVIGSHHDAVPNGGKYDGAMGILLGIEVMRKIKENNIKLRHPYRVLMFTAEEPNPFGISTMGSRAVTGKLSYELLNNAYHCENGMKLSDAILAAGGNIEKLADSQIKQGEMSAFIECHIEQSSNLDDMKLPLAVVSTVTGIYREIITVKGEANHAGTTPMTKRKDALTAASECILAIEKTAREYKKSDVVATVGKLDVTPNAANIIPDMVSFIMEIRTSGQTEKNDFISKMTKCFNEIEIKRNVQIGRKINLNQAEVTMDVDVQDVLRRNVIAEQGKEVTLVSMAGHDAVHMTGKTKTAMLFVRSINGKSHCNEEYTRSEDIASAGNVLLNTILELDKVLD